MYIRLLHSFILTQRLNLKWKAIFEIETILGSECSYNLKVAASYFLGNIEKELEDFELVNSQSIGIDIKQMMQNQKQNEELRELFKEACSKTIDLWTELSKPKPKGNLMQAIGLSLTVLNDKIKASYIKISQSRNSNIRTLDMYAHYLKLVMCEQSEAKRVHVKVENIYNSLAANRFYSDERSLKFFENVNPCITVVSGDYRAMGTIKSANSEVLKTLEFSADDIVGKHVNLLMPRVYAEHHDYWMHRYFEYNHDKVMNHERKIFAMNKRGFLVPCKLLIKVYPCLANGIEIVGVFSRTPGSVINENTILIDGNTGTLLGVTENCYLEFGIHPKVCYSYSHNGSPYSILKLFPKIKSLEEIVERKVSFTEQILNTESLKVDHIVQKNDLGVIGLPYDKLRTFRSFKVKIDISKPCTHNTEGMKVIEVVFKESTANSAYDRRVSNMVLEDDQSVGFQSFVAKGSSKSRQKLPLKPSLGVKSADFDNIVQHTQGYIHHSGGNSKPSIPDIDELNEEELKELNERAEMERKLKEKKQMLRNKRHPTLILLLYLVLGIMALLSTLAHSVALFQKNIVNSYLLSSVLGVERMKTRLSLSIDVVFHLMKYNNLLL